jgi:MHS family proline/betaine transporter-like MFS transporter
MFCLLLVLGVGYYMMFVYAVSYLTDDMHVSTARAMDIGTLSLIVMTVVMPFSAILSDRIGRKPLLYFVNVGSLVLAWPLWWLMHHDNDLMIFLGQTGFGVLFGVGLAVTSAVLAEILPTAVRCSGVAVGYNIAFGIFGGTAPLIATYLVSRTADDFTPAYYLMATAVLAVVATVRLPETAGRPLA